MEENVQRIFAVLISVIIFFLLPMYITFEKKDDISYALSLKITTDFVENVRNNGFISRKMYDDFVHNLAMTANTYDIYLEHKTKKYNPVIYAYENDKKEKIVATYDYIMYKDKYDEGSINNNKNLALSYKLDEQINNEKQIMEVLDRNKQQIYIDMAKDDYINIKLSDIVYEPNIYYINEKEDNVNKRIGNIYTMNKGDEFTVRVKNTNVTTAEVFFNTFTLGSISRGIPRVYINYGGTVINEKYKNRGTLKQRAYNLVAQDNASRYINGEKKYVASKANGFTDDYINGEFAIEFTAKPNKEIYSGEPDKNINIGRNITFNNADYGLIIFDDHGGDKIYKNAGIGVGLGTNGIVVIAHSAHYYHVLLAYMDDLSVENKYRISINNGTPTLYINNNIVDTKTESVISDYNNIYTSFSFGTGYYGKYTGTAKDFKFFKVQ